jgi:heterodisulfide reductase subunit A
MNLKNDEDVAIEVEWGNASPAALVIGGGIAGIQAALDIADAGFKVYLVEREPSIGGHMAQLDKTFPTLDCSACILTPKMVDVARHPNIVLLTYSEVEAVKGEAGRFRVRVRKKARSVDMEKCTSCGLCAENCIIRYMPYVEKADRGGGD